MVLANTLVVKKKKGTKNLSFTYKSVEFTANFQKKEKENLLPSIFETIVDNLPQNPLNLSWRGISNLYRCS